MADSPVVVLMNEYRRGLRAWEEAQVADMVGRWFALEQRLAADVELLASDVAARKAAGEVVSQGTVLRMERYGDLLAQITAELDLYEDYATGKITAGQLEMGQRGIMQAAGLIEATTEGAVAFNRLPIEAAEMMAGLLADGSPLDELLLNGVVRAEAVDGMTRALMEGTTLGWNPRKTARAMKDGLARGLNQALTVARSEQLRVYRELSRQQYAASGVVDGYYRLVTKDGRTCMACLVRDGELIPVDQSMDEHPNGRCAMVPLVAGFEAPQWQKGVDWFLSRSPEQQRAQMGVGKFEAWQAGGFELSELARTVRGGDFGDNLQTRTLEELS